MKPKHWQLQATEEIRVLDLLLQHTPLKDSELLTLFANGCVWIQQQRQYQRCRNPELKLKTGQSIDLYQQETSLLPCPYKAELIADFDSFSIWFKPAGMFSQGSKWGDHWALYRWVEMNALPDRQCFITHRLDRYTSGLAIVAHSKEMNRHFHREFEKKKIKKTYCADVIDNKASRLPDVIDTPIEGKQACTRILSTAVTRSEILRIIAQPETGRKHQLRRHLASSGFAIVNDRLYGNEPHDGDLSLQAIALEFVHPETGEKMKIDLPGQFLLP